MFGLVLLGLASLAAPSALAGPPSESPAPIQRPLADAIELDAGTSCLDHSLLLQHLATWRDDPNLDARIRVVVRGGADPRRVGFEVLVGDNSWIERTFDPAPQSCADRHAVVALAIAIALDDTLAEELGLIAPSEPQPFVPGTDDERPPDDPVATPGGRRTRLGLTLAAGMFAGVHPQLGGGGLASFDVGPIPHFDLRFGGFATHLANLDFSEGTIASTVAAGRIDLCWGTLPRRIRLRICGGFAAGALHAKPRGFDRNLPQTLPWLAGLAEIDLVVRLVGPLALELRIDGFAALQRNVLDLSADGAGTVASLRYPAGGLIIGVGPRFEF